MFISTLDLFKVGVGPSSSHTIGPMVAASCFRSLLHDYTIDKANLHLRCILKGSLSFTGRGHATDRAVLLGLHGYQPVDLVDKDVSQLCQQLFTQTAILLGDQQIGFTPSDDIIFDQGAPLPEHPNGLIFELFDELGDVLHREVYFSIGGGFINTKDEIQQLIAPLQLEESDRSPYGFNNAGEMLQMAVQNGLTIAQMKRENERARISEKALKQGLNLIWMTMQQCLQRGLKDQGELPGGLGVQRRARHIHQQLLADPQQAILNDWLSAYAIAVNEENAAGHVVVTAPTNGAAGVIPAVLYYVVNHQGVSDGAVHDFLLTAAAIGGIIKHNSSISGAEVGCQGEVGSAAAMAAAGLCAIKGGTPQQIEHAAEIALEHHLGMTCDPVKGLVQVPCIERNAFGAIKAYTAASLALRGSGEHVMPLDSCIAAMKQTGLEMSLKFKETALGGLAVSLTEC